MKNLSVKKRTSTLFQGVTILMLILMNQNIIGQSIGIWRMEGNAVDATGNNPAGTLYGSPATITGQIDQALQFDGTDDYIDLGNIDLGYRFTICLWFNLASSGNKIRELIGNTTGGAEKDGFKLYINNPWENSYDAEGQIWFQIGDGTIYTNVLSPTGLVTVGGWNHIAVTVDKSAGTSSIYYNGTEVTQQSISIDFETNATTLIGRIESGGSYFPGNIDDVHIYNKVLSSSEINSVKDTGIEIGGGSTVPVTGVSLNTSSTSVAVGLSTVLSATVTPPGATNPSVTWSSSNTSIATVNSSGIVTGVAIGTATINVTTIDGNFGDNCTVNVSEAPAGGNSFWQQGTGGIYYADKVGIGTTEPTYKLHVTDNDRMGIRLGGPSTSTGAVGDLIFYPNDGVFINGAKYWDWSFRTDSWSGYPGDFVLYSTNGSSYTSPIIFQTDGDVILGAGGDYAPRRGNVGIGTINPDYKLHVDGDINFTGQLLQNGTVIDLGGGGSSFWNTGTGGIFYDGKIGIGTTNPTEMLTVKGTVLAERVNVVLDVPSSDYVFNSDYKLMTLHELDAFIQANKHLPEVPSATEFKENGYSVGEMDDLLLRKIEELTLYILELEKKIIGLENRIQTQ